MLYNKFMKTTIFTGVSYAKTLVCLTLMAVLLLMFSCSRSNSPVAFGGGDARQMSVSYDAGPAATSAPRMMSLRAESQSFEMEVMEDSLSASDAETIAERKLVRRAFIRIRVENLDTADAFVTTLIGRFDAYAASTSIEENNRHYSLRVPSYHYDTFLAEMNGMGRLLNRHESTEDVTLRYLDLEGRVASKRQLLQTFQSYLGRANNIEEILAVEARIADLLFDIENTETQLRHLANRVDYATIDLSLLGPAALTPAQSVTFGERIKQIFNGFGSFLSTIAVIIVGFLVYGIPILLLLCLLYWLLFGKIGLMKKFWNFIRK